jgi:hypothetical protein
LAHAQADHLTSEVSTFPFSRKECAQFTKLLAGAEDHLDDGRIVCLIARLRQSIMTNRFWTHHGQDTARCSRDQSILEDADQDKEFTWVRRLSSPLTFGTSERYCKQLEDAFTDRLVYKDVWRKVVASNLNDWKRTSLHAYLALLLHALYVMSQGPSLVPIISASMFLGSILTSTTLQHQYEPLKDSSADRGHDHLSSIYSSRLRFSLVSLAFALPRALYLWGLISVTNACLFMLTTTLPQITGPYAAVGLISLLLLAAFVAKRATSETSVFPEWSFRRVALDDESSV